VALDETLGAVTERLRATMTRQLRDMEHLKVLKTPLAEADGAPLMLSNPGPINLPAFIVAAFLQEVVHDIDPKDSSEWAFLLTHASCAFAQGVPEHWILTHANKVVMGEEDILTFQAMCVKGMRELTMDMTVHQALQKIDPSVNP
jgi:hypothetical protein